MAGHPTFREAFRFWLKLGFISFGGPAGQIAVMQQELVERKKWIGQQRFMHALNFCMLLPGPEAQQLAIYCGWLLHRTWGGIMAGALFVLPSALLLWVLSVVYVVYGHFGWLAAIFHGLKPAVVAIVVAAVLRMGKKSLRNAPMWGIAAAAFVLIFFLKTPFPLIVAGALLLGWVGGRLAPAAFAPPGGGHGGPKGASPGSAPDQAAELPLLAGVGGQKNRISPWAWDFLAAAAVCSAAVPSHPSERSERRHPSLLQTAETDEQWTSP